MLLEVVHYVVATMIALSLLLSLMAMIVIRRHRKKARYVIMVEKTSYQRHDHLLKFKVFFNQPIVFPAECLTLITPQRVVQAVIDHEHPNSTVRAVFDVAEVDGPMDVHIDRNACFYNYNGDRVYLAASVPTSWPVC